MPDSIDRKITYKSQRVHVGHKMHLWNSRPRLSAPRAAGSWECRLAQDALYYHSGPKAPIPQDEPDYVRRLGVPAGMRKTGQWMVCLSGLISTQAIHNQYYLDRQGHLEIFH